MELLLIVVLVSLSVALVMTLAMALRVNSPVDVDGWHRKLRLLRETIQPDADPVADEGLIEDLSPRNVRLLQEDIPGGPPAPDS